MWPEASTNPCLAMIEMTCTTSGTSFPSLATRANGRCWLVGDSAQVLEPLTGEGIYSALVTAEMALAIVLLVGAALLIRTFVALGTVNRGFNAHDVLTLRMSLSTPRLSQTSRVVQLVRDGVQRINAVPGVASAGAAVALPLESDWLSGYTIAGQPSNGRPPGLASFRII